MRGASHNPEIRLTISQQSWMQRAIALAQQATAADEVPVGAIIVAADGTMLAQAHNLVETRQDPTAHAEMLAIRDACNVIGSKSLAGATLFVTLEPCAMCAQAISNARISRLVFGAYDSKSGGVEHGARVFQQSTCHHAPEVIGGTLERECAALLQHFFQAKRK
jgi:tRNA(adenine34) deaminase